MCPSSSGRGGMQGWPLRSAIVAKYYLIMAVRIYAGGGGVCSVYILISDVASLGLLTGP